MAKYSKKAQDKIEKVMHERKEGTLKRSSGKKVTSTKQAIAIALSEVREAGMKVPAEKPVKKNIAKKSVKKEMKKSGGKSAVKKATKK